MPIATKRLHCFYPDSRATKELPTWHDVKGAEEWNLLTGNGVSMNFWDGFAYYSLFDVATGAETKTRLTVDSNAAFKFLETKNFEKVLEFLNKKLVDAKQARDELRAVRIQRMIENIKQALISAILCTHPKKHELGALYCLSTIAREYFQYQYVVTTSHEMIPYWITMDSPGNRVDFLFGGQFNANDTNNLYPGKTGFLYPHGTLYLYREPDGRVRKLDARNGGLLDQVKANILGGKFPHIVTEGSSQEKVDQIRRSEYLSFALDRFAQTTRPLVILGQSLSKQDDHLVTLMNARSWHGRMIAYGIYGGDQETVTAEMRRIIQILPYARLKFFSSNTHPLCHPSLKLIKRTATEIFKDFSLETA